MSETVCVTGYFNPIDASHIDYFKRAKRVSGADKLMVLVKDDPLGKATKVLRELKCVDTVIQVEETFRKTLDTLEKVPDFYCVGRHFNQRDIDACEHFDIQVIQGVELESDTWLRVLFRKIWESVEYLLYNHI